jgi:hypothetical protein
MPLGEFQEDLHLREGLPLNADRNGLAFNVLNWNLESKACIYP